MLTAPVAPAKAQALDIETGFEVLQDPATRIEGLHRLYVGANVAPRLSFGQAIYSAATGDAGGAFFWGVEAVQRVPLGAGMSLAFSGFAGGGGGAAQVTGDGTMLRLGAVAEVPVAQNWAVQAGVSRISISGANIDDWAASFGLAWRPGANGQADTPGAWRLRSASVGLSRLRFPGDLTRSGTPQPDLDLVGIEASFHAGPGTEIFAGADGAAEGGDGYMQVYGGARKRLDLGAVSLFGQASAGFGGGGDVDTGAGAMIGAAAGVAVPLGRGFDAELSYGVIRALDSGLDGTGVQARLTRVFDRGGTARPGPSQDWQVSIGLSAQSPNNSYMKSGSNAGISPVMQESAIDLFISDATYLTGNAQTTVNGGVAGFAIGMIGLGHEFTLSDTWRLSLEGHVGAAGGGGVDVGRGLVGSVRAEIDYLLSPRNAVSLGIGTLRAIDGGANVPVMQLGFKHRFSTH